MEDKLVLRPFTDDDLSFIDRICTDPEALGVFEWSGFSDSRSVRRRWESDGLLGPTSYALAVAAPDGAVAGVASWEPRPRGRPVSACIEFGVALLPECRGRGWGTTAHVLLVRYLFDTTLVHRLEALTEADNVAEQAVLQRLGFHREGVLRAARFRQGAWRDLVIYSLLRDEREL